MRYPRAMSEIEPQSIAAVIVAAGQGSRAGGGVPKQFRQLDGVPVLRRSVAALAAYPGLAGRLLVVIGEGQEAMAREALGPFRDGVELLAGGTTRRGSVWNALAVLRGGGRTRHVLIHDAARPHLPAEVIARLIEALRSHEGAVPVLPVADSLLKLGESGPEPISRDLVRRVQTPQAFHLDAIIAAHRAWPEDREATDDASMLHAAGGRLALVEGDEMLAKLTYEADFAAMECSDGPVFRIGSGYDVHRLVPDRELWLGGVRIPFERGLKGHSDADVALHAITDALLGAIGDGDIGMHFPPSDAKWKNAASDKFLEDACDRLAKAGYAISNIDLTIICERPKIGPFRDAIRTRIAEICTVPVTAISVKATTTEGLGFTGRGEAIAAQAAVLLNKKS